MGFTPVVTYRIVHKPKPSDVLVAEGKRPPTRRCRCRRFRELEDSVSNYGVIALRSFVAGRAGPYPYALPSP